MDKPAGFATDKENAGKTRLTAVSALILRRVENRPVQVEVDTIVLLPSL